MSLEYEIASKCISFGDYILSSGKTAEYYIDMRTIFNEPQLMNKLAEEITYNIKTEMNELGLSKVLISSVPTGTIPISALISQKMEMPLIMPRKSQKTYGNKKSIEGLFHAGDSVVVIEDVVTTGNSLLETLELIISNNLTIGCIVVLLDRMQGGIDMIQQKYNNVPIIIMFDINTLFKSLYISDYPNKVLVQRQLCKHNKTINAEQYFEHKNNENNNLAYVINHKKSNLCVSLDTKTVEEMLDVAKIVAPHVCMVKIHTDMWNISDKLAYHLSELKKLSQEYNFLIMDDAKIADVGHISCQKIDNSIGDLITIHSFSLTTEIMNSQKCNLIVIESMSHTLAQNTINKINHPIKYDDYQNKIAGFVTQDAVRFSNNTKTNLHNFITMAPGVKLYSDKIGDQNYMTLEEANARHIDVIIVGRDICQQPLKLIEEKTIEYKEKYWNLFTRF